MEIETIIPDHVIVRYSIGVRFVPTDEELIIHYLTNKVFFRPLPAKVMKDIDADEFYNKAPEELVDSDCDEREWYFFIHNDDYFYGKQNSVRSVGNGIGFWRLQGNEEPIYDNNGVIFAFKVQFTYYSGPTSESRTAWQMEEYRLTNQQYRKQKVEEWVIGKITQGKIIRGTDRYDCEND